MATPEDALRYEARRVLKRPDYKVDPEDSELRLIGYKARVGVNYQCPLCWMRDEVRSPLDPIPTGTRDDAFGCDRCGSDYLIER